jgi:acetyltransferase
VHQRFLQSFDLDQRITHDRLARICFNDFDREIALAAEHRDPKGGKREILGVGRLSRVRGTDRAEFAIVVADRHQRRGLGTELLSKLFDAGRQEGIRSVFADTLPDNAAMKALAGKFGIQIEPSSETERLRAKLDL